MVPRGRSSLVLLILLGFCFAALRPAVASTVDSSEEKLSVRYIDTPVKFRSATNTDWQTLPDTATALPESGDLLVEEGGALDLRSADSTAISLNEQSGLSYRLSEDTVDRLRLNHGSLKTTVEETAPERTRLRLETPMGSLGIRGTEFGVSFERSGRSEVYVDTGKVALRTGEERRGVGPGEYLAFGSGEGRSPNRILEEGNIPERYQLTWSRFRLKERLDALREMRSRLTRRLRGRVEGPGSSESSSRLDTLNRQIQRLNDRYQPLNERYQAYRERLEERREDFIRRRKQALDQYRRRRMRNRRKMRERRQRGQEEMLERREELDEIFGWDE